MIVTDKFVYVHLPRSGGNFVLALIKRFFPSANEIGYHLPRSLLPKQYRHLPVLGAVRNPWEFYVSWYHHVWPRDAGTPLISWVTENGTQGFEGTIRNAANLGADNERLDALIASLPEQVDYNKRNIPNITKDAMCKFRGRGVGYYTFRFTHLFGNAEDVYFCQIETLRQDLIRFFEQLGLATDELREYVLHTEKQNTAHYRHYSSYYSRELAELVRLRDSSLIKRFGYRFERVVHSTQNPNRANEVAKALV